MHCPPDLHGQSHDVHRIQLGYVLNKAHLGVSDDVFERDALIQHSSVRELSGYTAEKHGRSEQSVVQVSTYACVRDASMRC